VCVFDEVVYNIRNFVGLDDVAKTVDRLTDLGVYGDLFLATSLSVCN